MNKCLKYLSMFLLLNILNTYLRQEFNDALHGVMTLK